MIIPEEVKRLYQADSVRKNLRIHFPNGESADIVNDKIVAESFSFTERLCSQSTLKFGLCEASVVEFECVGIGNIKGYEIAVYHEIDISSLSEAFIAEYGMTSDDVGFLFYQIPYGVFVVDECHRQSDMKKRKVVAYTKEVNWDAVPNTLERAKTDGRIDLKYNSPYKFNVASLVYSNLFTGNEDLFEDKALISEVEAFSNSYGRVMYSDANAYSPDGTTMTDKYAGYVYFETLYVPITSNTDADKLYWLKYADAVNIENFLNVYEGLINNATYQWNGKYAYLTIKEIEYALKHGFYNYQKYVYTDGTYHTGYKIPFDNHHYVYPFMNYTSTEETQYKQTVIEEKTFIAVPYNVRIEIVESIYSSSDNEFVRQTILSETFNIRDEDTIEFYTINNLPQIYYSVERKKYTANSYSGYRPTATDLPLNDIAASYIEFLGEFGKYDRQGEFDFFKLDFGASLYPSESLYPSNDLYPNVSNNGLITRTSYMSAWYDENPTKPYGRVSVTYTNKSNEKAFAYYPIVDDATYNDEEYQTYSLEDNFLIQKCIFTAEQIAEILETVATNIRNVHYTPSEIELIGRPDIEAGDVVQVITKDGGFETIVLERTLSGIQSLTDNFDARG